MKFYTFILIAVFSTLRIAAQLSPGELSLPHSSLEGLSNCTQCHVLGNKVSSEKCLTCHKEIKERISLNKGYHVSSQVKGKECFVCHSDHHGKKFQLIKFDIQKFDHNLTGFGLSAPHAKKECRECHSGKNIIDSKVRARKETWLGLGANCLSCHDDYHRNTLSTECLTCHTDVAFKPASKFSHSSARFQLKGKHAAVACIKCHKEVTEGGKKYVEFKGIPFSVCTSCHKDPHQNKFGQDCSQCHNEDSFLVVKGVRGFDHNKTDFKLVGKHQVVNCKACHKGKFTDPLKSAKCTDCHSDYHKKQFAVNGVSPDCSKCHNVKGFNLFSFTPEQHNQSAFPLKGSHEAIPCFECHKKQKDWNFRGIGINCKDCHKDVHQAFIPAKYYPESNCSICHNSVRWAEVAFDHSKTSFPLTGAHSKINCRACHLKGDNASISQQKFTGLPGKCNDCHDDKHFRQFEKNGITDCSQCHAPEKWVPARFDHSKAAFKLDGKHINVPCIKCHKPQQEGSVYYVKYKLKVFTCESCHS
jgi:hypothetical protein